MILTRISISLVTALALAFGGNSGADAQGEDTVLNLKQSGWIVVEKTIRDEKFPGVIPYQNLVRVVHVSTYIMQKEGVRRTCRMSQDTMLDSIEQTCDLITSNGRGQLVD
jgi:hypothetical protein